MFTTYLAHPTCLRFQSVEHNSAKASSGDPFVIATFEVAAVAFWAHSEDARLRSAAQAHVSERQLAPGSGSIRAPRWATKAGMGANAAQRSLAACRLYGYA